MESSAGMDLLRSIFLTFDKGIYSLIGLIYELIENIAEAKIVESTFIENISDKIYSFIGIFMLFKITFSLINYIINPDSIIDKQKGGAKLITNILITFGLIIFAPVAFDILYDAQSAILGDDIIGTIVSSENSKNFRISEKCGDIYIVPGSTFGSPDVSDQDYQTGEFISMVAIRPFVQVEENPRSSNDINALINDTNYCRATTINDLLTSEIINHDNSSFTSIYTVDYRYFISTIAGIIILAIIAGFTLDVSLRAIKLVFLEAIAPIPIMSYIDPSSSKNGMFAKWLKEVGITWADLFIRLFAITFSTSIIGAIQMENNSNWINLFLIIGVLLFVKKLPDILKKMFNIDLKGDFKLNPFKRFTEESFGGKTISNVGHSIVGAAGGTIAGAKAGMNAGAPIKGAILGAASGASQGWSEHKKTFSSSMNKVYKNMTGNDITNLTPAKILLNMGGKGTTKVEEVKGHLKVANSKLNTLQSKLSETSHYNSSAYKELRDQGIDVSKLTDERNIIKEKIKNEQKEYSSTQTQIHAANNQLNEARNTFAAAKNVANESLERIKAESEVVMANAKAELEKAQRFLSSYKPLQMYEGEELVYKYSPEYYANHTIVDNYDSKIKTMETEIQSKKAKIEQELLEKEKASNISELEQKLKDLEKEEKRLKTEMSENEELLKVIEIYEKTKKEEEELRAEIAKKEKEISTLKDEKSDRERFYQVDTSTKTSVEDAMKNNPVEKE